MRVNAYRNRLVIDTANKDGIKEVRNGGNPFWWNGSAVQFECALFNLADLVTDISNFDSMTCEIKRGDDAKTGLALMAQTITSGSLLGTLTEADWDAGDESKCHVKFAFTGAQADLDLLGEDTATLWLVISGLRTDGEPITLGCTQVFVEEDGRGTGTPAGVVGPTYYTAAQSDARFALSVNLTTINNNITTLQGQMTTVTASAATANTTANAALPKAGGTMTGHIALYTGTNPTGSQAISAGRADALYLALAGGTVTGATTFSAVVTASTAPTLGGHLCNKTYVDSFVSLAGGTMTGDLVLPNSTAGSALKAATQGYVTAAINSLIAAAPGTLDTLNELAIALGNDANFSTTMTTALAGKLALAGGTMTGHISLYVGTNPTGNQAISAGRADAVYLALAGGTVTGLITASTAPSSGGHLCNKTYVDAQDALRLALTGGTMTGLLGWSTTTSAGLRLNNLTDAQRAALASPGAGSMVFNTTSSLLQVFDGSTWVTLQNGTGTLWLTGSGAPGAGLGTNGNYYLDSATGAIYLKASGSWAYASPQGHWVNGIKVVSDQQSAIADTTASTAANTTSINAILAALRAHGLIHL